MHLVDHLFVIALATAVPWLARRGTLEQIALIKRGKTPDRASLYRRTAIEQWCAFWLLLAFWAWQGRPFAALGYEAPGGTGFWIGVVLTVIAVGLLFYAWRKAAGMSPDEKRKELGTLGDLAMLMPKNGRELRYFTGLSVTAGVVEETVFRGYLFWYFAPLLPVWATVLLTSLLFGLVHIYQGYKHAARIFVVGLVFAALYVLTGSIWVPIVLHALADILQGAALVELSKNGSPSVTVPQADHQAAPAD